MTLFGAGAWVTIINDMMATAKLQAGYECRFVDPPKDVQTECSICLHILREPYLVGCCGYRFCRSCIEGIGFGAKKRCPMCKATFSTLPDKQLQRLLNQKRVYCSNEAKGCKWVGELSTLEEHLNEEPTKSEDVKLEGCRFVTVPCKYCKQLFQRRFHTAHERTCPKRLETCKYCKKFQGSHEDIVCTHILTCVSYPVKCPNGCGASPFRKNLENHVDNSCPLTVIECGFKYADCDVQLPRKEMVEHVNDNMSDHIALTMTKIAALEEENKILKERLSDKDRQISLLQKGNEKHQPGSLDPSTAKFLRVWDLPNIEQRHRHVIGAVFGQYGKVSEIKWSPSKHQADVYYVDPFSISKAIARSETDAGIKFRGGKLSVYPIH